jgi:probable rRNA maturation factor
MPFTVAVLDEAGYGRLGGERATELCAAAFSSRGFDVERMGEVSVVLAEPDVIRDLNLTFREKNEPTDVLSFVLDGPYGDMVGEVVICPACASPEMGVEELVVHGTLHLSGMDHGEDFEGSEMARMQEAVMEAVRDAEG